MRISLKRFRLGTRIALLGAGGVILTALFLVGFVFHQSGQYNRLAQTEVDGLINLDLDHITQGVYNLVQTENEAVRQQIDRNLEVAQYMLSVRGGVGFAKERVEWSAVNQATGEVVPVTLPQLRVGGQWMGTNADPHVETPIVDELSRLFGASVSLYQRMNERGDMVCAATTLTNREGRRVVGTFIPAVRADGTDDPAIRAVLNGSSCYGQDYILYGRFLIACKPLFDEGGRVTGLLHVGIRQRDVEARLHPSITQIRIGKTGYVFVLGSKTRKRGHYIVSQQGSRDDEDIWESRDSDGQYNVQMIIRNALLLEPGEMTTVRYRWQNPGEPEPRWKVARLAYYEPWDWVIGASVYEDELQSYYAILEEGRHRMMRTMGFAGLAIALAIGWIGVVLTWTITAPIREMRDSVEGIIQGRIDQPVRVRSRDEIGALADAFNVMTERLSRTLNDLRKSEEQYRGIFENSLEGLFQSSFSGHFLNVNPAMAEILGYDSPEDLIRTVRDIPRQLYVKPEDREAILASLRRSGRNTGVLVQFRRKNGSIIWVSISARVVRDELGAPLFIEGFLSDVTARKLAEDALRDTNRQLADIIDFLPDATMIISREGTVIAWNRAMEEMTGVSKADMLGKDHTFATLPFYGERRRHLIDLLEAEDAELAEKYEFVTRKGQALYAEAFAPAIRGGQGGTIWAIAAPLLDAEGRMVGAIESVRDITDRKQAEEELKRHRDRLEELVKERTAQLVSAKEQAESANRAKSAFLAKMSHELRTPLNAILGYAQVFRRRSLDDDMAKGLDIIQHSGEHLLTLINDILSLSKIESGKMSLQRTTVYFDSFIKGIIGIIRARAEGKGLEFVFEPDGPLPSGITADETRLRQVLLNLLDNAVKYTDEGRVVLRVIRPKDSGEDAARHPTASTLLRFEVEDTGEGIPPDQLRRIFLPFEQATESPRWVEGSGLGLTISRQLVQLMGGDLHVASKPGKGSLFWFEISVPITESEGKKPAPVRRPRVITGYRGPRRKLLIVDDIASNRDVLSDLLRPLGFELVEAVNGHQAIDRAEQERPDLILMDRFMPVMNGFAAAMRLRERPAIRSCAIIAVSASVTEEDRAKSREAGFDDFLPKPIRWAKLAALLEKHLHIDWEYLEETPSPRRRPAASSRDFTPPSVDVLNELMALARMGDLAAIQERAVQLKNEHAECRLFADKLSLLAGAFEEQQILAFLRTFMQEAS